ncbi:MAG: hypothetical protein RL007_2184 [Bacteroidota bacterium]|jgi:hypothetical protein
MMGSNTNSNRLSLSNKLKELISQEKASFGTWILFMKERVAELKSFHSTESVRISKSAIQKNGQSTSA